ncbi:GNAT family N-acetyltransferase [Stenotrophomonas maltophilia]|uniref:GNAT family N-acetyltransferase n=1 Tax=Stenotrophomonas maltophilia TaxID=40324 RepID=UPI0002FED3D6|nr:GNAT family N-acetyltransferase [Stenotrophomonas maltophilia]
MATPTRWWRTIWPRRDEAGNAALNGRVGPGHTASRVRQTAFHPGYQTRAIQADGELVGFFMWVPETPQRTSIWRFMVDQRWQGRGIGRRALELALAQIRATPGVAEVEICYNPRNPVAGAFYGSFGFVETGMDDDGEDMLAVLPVAGLE